MSRVRCATWCAALTTGVLCAAASALDGQSVRVIRGTVIDANDRPVSAVAVMVAVGGARAISDDSGRFRLEISHRDHVLLELRRVGFMPSRMGLTAGGDTAVSVLLLPGSQRLTGVEVTAASTPSPPIAGFEERARQRKHGAGVGHYIAAKEIEKLNAIRTTQIVENVPSVRVRRIDGERFAIFGRSAGGGECPATLYLDGVRLGGSGEPLLNRRGRVIAKREASAPIDQYVDPTDIAGVEVYARGMLAPQQFQPLGDPDAIRCAIVVFWTKHAP